MKARIALLNQKSEVRGQKSEEKPTRTTSCAQVVLAFCLVAVLLPLAAVLFAAQATLDDVLSKMDAAAVGFRNVQGDITYTKVTVIVNDKSIEKGQFFFERLPPKRGLPDLRIRINFTEKNDGEKPQPSERTVLVKDNEAHIYNPKIKQVTDVTFDKSKRAVLDQFFSLGFGTSSRDLQGAYTVKLGGEEKVNGEDIVRLDLTPKSEAAARDIRSVQLFLSKKTWQPTRQVFNLPGGDYSQADYGSLKINAPLPKGAFDLNLPKGVKHVNP